MSVAASLLPSFEEQASYAARKGLFRVVSGWTWSYYVKLSSVGVTFERVSEDGGVPAYTMHGVDPTQSELATPVGVLGPFEDPDEAEAALLAIARLFPEESFVIQPARFASGLVLPAHLPRQQDLARKKVSALSTRWRHIGPFLNYYTLDSEEQIAPFGKLGPFPSLKELRAAEKAVRSRFPGSTVVKHQCGLQNDQGGGTSTRTRLCVEYAKTLEKLAALGA